MKTIGFIGLGTMGLPMAANLAKKGFHVIAYNRTSEKTAELEKIGAEAAGSPAEAARSADTLFTMVSNDNALSEVLYGSGGIMEGVHPGLTVIDCSTVSPRLSLRIHRDLAAHFVNFLDAPVSGGKLAATDGTLTFMVGGSHDVFLENLDVFQGMGRRIVYMGPAGSGSQTKLAHNTIAAINNAALSEGLAMAARSGIDLERFFEVVLNGAAASKQAELKRDKILKRDFAPQFSLELMLKDLDLSSDFAAGMKLPMPLMQTARSLFQIAEGKGLGALDFSSVVRCYEDWIGQPIGGKVPTTDKPQSLDGETSGSERRKNARVTLNIRLQLSVYQWEREGAFSGQIIEGILQDLSESGLQIASKFPLAKDMFVVIHFPEEAGLPPITGRIIRVETREGLFTYGCMLSGLPPHTRKQLEKYVRLHAEKQQ
ncbi:NAD(P)-binding domain-containing protein [Ferviditalea candida]|uniref:NAD(P)-binding domain-containing protein n=1 Tax=Ferviditalea candida TaxID=3108399 RepID=A0ABU5ZER4_9BACL|nr:NAD(P)-binding domain-containing protein [Paenibacillaceae bacterium T2]